MQNLSETAQRVLWWAAAIVAAVAFVWFSGGMPIHKLAIALLASLISLAVLLGAFEGIWHATSQGLKGADADR